jgi:hypothetical protein
MAKMFYTLEETARKLGVKDMAKSGQIQEFRDRDKIMFKVEQIDLLAGGGEDEPIRIDQELTSKGFDAASSGSGIGLVDSREDTGISVFDTGHGTKSPAPSSGDTHVSETVEEELSLESVGSGSGLLDLTRESDDTSLGAELLEEVYSSEEVEVPAAASGLFEAAGAESPGNQYATTVAATPVLVETYDGAGSGLGVGFMLGAFAALVCLAVMVFVGVSGATPALATQMAGSLWIWAGALLIVTLVLGGIGFFIGKASE